MPATTKPKTKPAPKDVKNPYAMVLDQRRDEDPGEVLANAMLGQDMRHGLVAANFAQNVLASTEEALALMDCASFMKKRAADAIAGDLAFISAMLASQALSLDNMFTEFARRAAINIREYPLATERYGRLAMKAQANSRATLEALAKLHQPREQTVRHVHVDNRGGQAVITETVQTGEQENGVSVGQPLAIEGSAPSLGQPLWCENAEREALPIARDA